MISAILRQKYLVTAIRFNCSFLHVHHNPSAWLLYCHSEVFFDHLESLHTHFRLLQTNGLNEQVYKKVWILTYICTQNNHAFLFSYFNFLSCVSPLSLSLFFSLCLSLCLFLSLSLSMSLSFSFCLSLSLSVSLSFGGGKISSLYQHIHTYISNEVWDVY